MNLSVLSRSISKVVAEPQRLRRLHYSKLLALMHSVVEPDDHNILATVFGCSARLFAQIEQDLLGDQSFRNTIESHWKAVRGEALTLFGEKSVSDHHPLGRLLYYCVRLLRPRTVLDTGVLDGFSSAFILKGLHDNGSGNLYSIDLPAYQEVGASSDKMQFGALPPGYEPGWVIPDPFRGRWTLRKGPSNKLLAPWLKELGTIDMFFHDSLHTNRNMLWEYTTAWSHVCEGGLLVSDDVFWNTAFWKFARRNGDLYIIKNGAGLVRKPCSRYSSVNTV